jgi:hypothetical protein
VTGARIMTCFQKFFRFAAHELRCCTVHWRHTYRIPGSIHLHTYWHGRMRGHSNLMTNVGSSFGSRYSYGHAKMSISLFARCCIMKHLSLHEETSVIELKYLNSRRDILNRTEMLFIE